MHFPECLMNAFWSSSKIKTTLSSAMSIKTVYKLKCVLGFVQLLQIMSNAWKGQSSSIVWAEGQFFSSLVYNSKYSLCCLDKFKTTTTIYFLPCHMHRWAGLGVLLIKALTLGSRIMYQLEWTVVVTTAEGEEYSTRWSKQALHPPLLFSPCPWQWTQPWLKHAAQEVKPPAGREPRNITHSAHLAAYSADLSLITYQMSISANRILF